MPNLLLIPVTGASEALWKATQPQGEESDLSDADVRELCALLLRCVRLSEVLVRYAKALSGKTSRN